MGSKRKSFWSLIVAQFLGAFNDNCFRFFLLFAAANGTFKELKNAKGEVDGDLIYFTSAALFTLPFILFSPHAGRVSDRYSKRSVAVTAKGIEILLMAAAAIGFYLSDVYFLVTVLFLMALQSTFFSPAKYGILPEMLPSRSLPRANGVLELSTFVAIIAGMIFSGFFTQYVGKLFVGGVLLTLLSFVGFVASTGIEKVPAQVPDRRLQLNPIPEMLCSVRAIWPERNLRWTAIGIAYFWSLGMLVQLVVVLYGPEELGIGPADTGLLLGAMTVGIGLGSYLAGRLSHEKPELGLVPLGSLGMGLFSVLLFWSDAGFGWILAGFSLMGLSGGFFVIPLNVLLQQEAPADGKGRVIAGVNLLSNVGMFLSVCLVWFLMKGMELLPSQVLLTAGLATIAATVLVFALLPTAFFRFLFWIVTRSIYRIRIGGLDHLPARGPALLVSNHVSYVDGFLVLASTHRRIRFVVYKGFTELPGLRWLSRTMGVIPISPDDGPRELVKSLRIASEALEKGELVCIFAEGQISRTGQLLPFRSGLEKILKGLDVPVIPVHLDRVWGSIFSYDGERFIWKFPRKFRYPVTIHFGEAMRSDTPAADIRQAVQELGSAAFAARKFDQQPLPWTAVKNLRRRPRHHGVADSTGLSLSRMKVLIASLCQARQLRQLFHDEPMIAILLPPSVGGALSNFAASLLGKPVVNLNYTAGDETLASAAEQCGVTKVLTSRAFLEKLPVKVPGEAIYLEDVKEAISGLEKLKATFAAWLLPRPLMRRFIGGKRVGMDDPVTVIFSSGSTGEPKGVVLSHFNILSNVQALAQVFAFGPKDILLGSLPYFHSTGYTVTLWVPLIVEMGAVYHPNPLDARSIGKLSKTYGVSILVATPTFLQGYTRRCQPGDFGSSRYVVVGAEKLTPQVRDAFREKFGVEPLEAYGATECSPMVSANRPDFLGRGIRQVGKKMGIGHPLPGVSVRIVDPETLEPRAQGEDGLLLVKGPNVMTGYLGKPELTAESVRDGWYLTGDIAAVDDDGFLTLTDRLARFTKISGEMVPNVKVEQSLHELLESCEQCLVVTSIPDSKRGEQLAVVHTLDEEQLATLLERLPGAGLPNLWVPRKDAFVGVDEIPVLGTGKVDLRKVRDLARSALGTAN